MPEKKNSRGLLRRDARGVGVILLKFKKRSSMVCTPLTASPESSLFFKASHFISHREKDEV